MLYLHFFNSSWSSLQGQITQDIPIALYMTKPETPPTKYYYSNLYGNNKKIFFINKV